MCLFSVWFDSLLDKNQSLICLDIHQNYKVVQQGKYNSIRFPYKTMSMKFSFGAIGRVQVSLALIRAALTTHELEWLEPWAKLAELELKCSNRELVYVGNTNVTQST